MKTTGTEFYKKPEENIEEYYARTTTPDRPGDIITAQTLEPATSMDFKTAEPEQIYPVAEMEIPKTPEVQMTRPETEAQELSENIRKINAELLGESAYRAEKREEFGVPEQEQAMEDLSQRLRDLQRKAKAIPISIQQEYKGRGVTKSGIRPIQTARLRENAIEALSVASLIDATQNKITSAKRKVADAVEQKFGEKRESLRVAKENLQIILDSPAYSMADKNRAIERQNILEVEEAILEAQEVEQKAVWEIAVDTAREMAKRGITDTAVLDKIQNAESKEEALRISTESGVFVEEVEEPVGLKTQVIEVGGRKMLINTQTGETIKDLGIAKIVEPSEVREDVVETVISGEFGDIVNGAAGLVGAERGRTSKKAIAKAISEKNYSSAYAQIANNVEESLTGTAKNRFANARTDYSVMSGMGEAIRVFADAGGDMGIFKGKADKIARNIGILASDPKFAALAIQLEREFQTYRNIMTGAAFTPAESREYEAVNPTTGKTLDLNLATIEGALNQLENRITGTIEPRIPGVDKLYEKVIGEEAEDVDPASAPIDSIIKIGGVRYKKVGEDKYQEI